MGVNFVEHGVRQNWQGRGGGKARLARLARTILVAYVEPKRLFLSSSRKFSSAAPTAARPGSTLLEECNPIVLVLVLMLVLVGRPSAGAHGSKKLILLAFLLSIHLLQKYEHSIILE
jgi:hypothetical protein